MVSEEQRTSRLQQLQVAITNAYMKTREATRVDTVLQRLQALEPNLTPDLRILNSQLKSEVNKLEGSGLVRIVMNEMSDYQFQEYVRDIHSPIQVQSAVEAKLGPIKRMVEKIEAQLAKSNLSSKNIEVLNNKPPSADFQDFVLLEIPSANAFEEAAENTLKKINLAIHQVAYKKDKQNSTTPITKLPPLPDSFIDAMEQNPNPIRQSSAMEAQIVEPEGIVQPFQRSSHLSLADRNSFPSNNQNNGRISYKVKKVPSKLNQKLADQIYNIKKQIESKQYEEALKLLKIIEQKVPEDAIKIKMTLNSLKMKILAHSGLYQQSASIYRKQFAQNKPSVVPGDSYREYRKTLDRAILEFDSNNLKKAEEYLKRAKEMRRSKKFNVEAREYILEGDLQAKKQNLNQALNIYEKALVVEDNYIAQCRKGDVYMQYANCSEKAITCYTLSSNKKRTAETFAKRAAAFRKNNQPQQAQQDLSVAHSLNKRKDIETIILNNLATVRYHRIDGTPDESLLIDFEKIELEDPNRLPVLCNLIVMLYNKGRVKKAIELIQKEQARYSEELEFQLTVAELYMKSNNVEYMKRGFETAVKLKNEYQNNSVVKKLFVFGCAVTGDPNYLSEGISQCGLLLKVVTTTQKNILTNYLGVMQYKNKSFKESAETNFKLFSVCKQQLTCEYNYVISMVKGGFNPIKMMQYIETQLKGKDLVEPQTSYNKMREILLILHLETRKGGDPEQIQRAYRLLIQKKYFRNQAVIDKLENILF